MTTRCSSEQTAFRTRIWKRLREFGLRDSEITKTWGLTQTLVSYHCGRNDKLRKQRRAFRARVWSRLVSAPISMTQIAIAELWRVSHVLVCREISALRYELLSSPTERHPWRSKATATPARKSMASIRPPTTTETQPHPATN